MNVQHDTQYFTITNIWNGAIRGETSHCVYIHIPKKDLWEYLRKIQDHLEYSKDGEEFVLTLCCELKPQFEGESIEPKPLAKD